MIQSARRYMTLRKIGAATGFAAMLTMSVPGAAQTAVPATVCDGSLTNDELHPQPGMPVEDGTQAFSYSAGGSFVSGGGGSVVLNVALTFEPGPDATIRVSALDEACGGANGARTVFSYTFSDLTTRNAIAYDSQTGNISFNGTVQTTSPTGTPRYLFVDVWDGALPSTRATHSYLIDLQNPANPTTQP